MATGIATLAIATSDIDQKRIDLTPRVAEQLMDRSWLGGVDFGGAPGELYLVPARAAGFYLVPPVLPGESGENEPSNMSSVSTWKLPWFWTAIVSPT